MSGIKWISSSPQFAGLMAAPAGPGPRTSGKFVPSCSLESAEVDVVRKELYPLKHFLARDEYAPAQDEVVLGAITLLSFLRTTSASEKKSVRGDRASLDSSSSDANNASMPSLRSLSIKPDYCRVTLKLAQEPCYVQLRSKPDKSYMVRPPPKILISGNFNRETDYLRAVLIESTTQKEIYCGDLKVLEGNTVDLKHRKSFENSVATFNELRVMVKPSTLHEYNGRLRFRFELMAQGYPTPVSVCTTKDVTLYSNYTQMNPDQRREYMDSNPKRKLMKPGAKRSFSEMSPLGEQDYFDD